MPEGVAIGGKAVRGAVHDDPDVAPAPGPDAPKGWTWDRKARKWAPRQRGPVQWEPGSEDSGSGAEAGAGTAARGEAPEPDQQRDPAPGWQASSSDGERPEQPRGRVRWSEVPREARDNAASLAGMLGIPLMAFAQVADPYCGGALASNYEPIIDAALPLILRSERAVAFFTSKDSDWLLWFGLAQALWPVATAVAQHHVFRSVEVVRGEGGQVTILHGDAAAAARSGDPLQPHAEPEFDPSAYAA